MISDNGDSLVTFLSGKRHFFPLVGSFRISHLLFRPHLFRKTSSIRSVRLRLLWCVRFLLRRTFTSHQSHTSRSVSRLSLLRPLCPSSLTPFRIHVPVLESGSEHLPRRGNVSSVYNHPAPLPLSFVIRSLLPHSETHPGLIILVLS